jgi:hypothetical protein
MRSGDKQKVVATVHDLRERKLEKKALMIDLSGYFAIPVRVPWCWLSVISLDS